MAKGLASSLLLAQCATLAYAAPRPATLTARADAVAPAEFTANPSIGGGGSNFVESAHFRVVGASTSAMANKTLQHLEAAHACFVETLGWRSPGLSFNTGGVGNEVGPWYKLNVYSKQMSELNGAAGVQGTDMDAGLAWLEAVDEYLDNPDVMVHEFGHAMHLSEKNWIHQGNTGAWWEPIANFIADTYISTPTCNAARAAQGLPGTEGDSIISLGKIITDSHQVLVDGTPDGTANYYESWPFLAYLTNNPDNYPALGNDTLLRMIREYELNSNETPLHSLQRILAGADGNLTVQHVVGRYWAHMAFVDIGHAKAHDAFVRDRRALRYESLDGANGAYTVKPARAPRYMGANIIPLTPTAETVRVVVSADDAGYSATLVVSGPQGVAYTDVLGEGSVRVRQGDEVALVVARTPEVLLYDAFEIGEDVKRGLQYGVRIEGATA